MEKTVVKNITVDLETGITSVLLHKRTLNDAGAILLQSNHRVMIDPISDIDEVAVGVNGNLSMTPVDHTLPGSPMSSPVDPAEWALVKQHAALVRRPAVVKVWQDRVDAQRAEDAARLKAQDDARVAAELEAVKQAALAEERFNSAVSTAVAEQLRKNVQPT